MRNEWGVDEQTATVMRANLEAVAAAAGTCVGGSVEANPDAPWWQGASELTMTIVVGSTAPDVAGVLGIDLLAMDRLLPFEVSVEEGASPLALFEKRGAVIIVEPNGWITAQPETVAALAVLGRTVALYWNVNYVSRFIVAENGEIVRDVDPVIDAGAGTGRPLPDEGGIDWGPDPIGQAAALQARLTGTALTRGEVFGTAYPTTSAPWPN